MEGQRHRTKTLLNYGIVLTFALSLLGNAVRAILGDRVTWFASQLGVFLLAAPGVLFLVFVVVRFAVLPLARPGFGQRRGSWVLSSNGVDRPGYGSSSVLRTMVPPRASRTCATCASGLHVDSCSQGWIGRRSRSACVLLALLT